VPRTQNNVVHAFMTLTSYLRKLQRTSNGDRTSNKNMVGNVWHLLLYHIPLKHWSNKIVFNIYTIKTQEFCLKCKLLGKSQKNCSTGPQGMQFIAIHLISGENVLAFFSFYCIFGETFGQNIIEFTILKKISENCNEKICGNPVISN